MTTPYVDPQSIHNPSTGTSPPASWGDTVRDDLEFLVRMPGCQVNRTDSLNIVAADSNKWIVVPFTAADSRDTDNYHAANSTDLVVPTGLGGWYNLTAYVAFQASNTGQRGIRFLRNGNVITRAIYADGINTFETRFTITDEFELAAGDVVTVEVLQNSGVGLLVNTVRLSMRLVSL